MDRKESESPQKHSDVNLWLFVGCMATLSFYLFFIVINTPNFFNIFNGEITGHLGDTINGLTAPFIAVLIAYLTYKAFIVQYEFNLDQRKDITRERFENKYYELLKLHKENLHEIQIKGYDGFVIEKRKAFVSMYKELRYVYFIVEIVYEIIRLQGGIPVYSKVQLLRLAYTYFYFGVGTHSNLLNRSSIGQLYHEDLWMPIRDILQELQQNPNVRIPLHIADLGDARLPTTYFPFGGHMSRLAHYYRHLYQIVDTVVSNKDLKEHEVESYLRMLRAQLSDHEQVLLYYDAASGFGVKWITKNYLTKYRMLHNVPLPLIEFGPPVAEVLNLRDDNGIYFYGDTDKRFFEWQEMD